MKQFTLHILLIVMSLSANAQSEINFNQNLSWEEILQKSKLENKIIFVDVYATWCGPCKKMDREVYTSPSVSSYLNQHFIAVKIQADKGKNDDENIKSRYQTAKMITQIYKVSSYPTYLFIDANGTLVHRDEGFYAPDTFASICKIAIDTTRNLHSKWYRYKAGKMGDLELLQYATLLQSYHEDSLAKQVARSFKNSFLEKTPPEVFLTPDVLPFFRNFTSLLTSKDSLVKYMYAHSSNVDKKMNTPGLSNNVIEFVSTNDFIEPKFHEAETEHRNSPDWTAITKTILGTWDKKTAEKTVLNAQIRWYTDKKDWHNAIKYHMKKIDNINNSIGQWDAFEINNFIWEIVLKHSDDHTMLIKSREHMENLINLFPEDHIQIDTYANVLYKLGDREKAITSEKKALYLAEKAKDSASAMSYRESISKMESNIPTWNEK